MQRLIPFIGLFLMIVNQAAAVVIFARAQTINHLQINDSFEFTDTGEFIPVKEKIDRYIKTTTTNSQTYVYEQNEQFYSSREQIQIAYSSDGNINQIITTSNEDYLGKNNIGKVYRFDGSRLISFLECRDIKHTGEFSCRLINKEICKDIIPPHDEADVKPHEFQFGYGYPNDIREDLINSAFEMQACFNNRNDVNCVEMAANLSRINPFFRYDISNEISALEKFGKNDLNFSSFSASKIQESLQQQRWHNFLMQVDRDYKFTKSNCYMLESLLK